MRKYNSKRLHVIVAALLLLIPALANSQPLIREIPFMDAHSLIRHLTADEWIIHSFNGQNTFYKVDDSSPAAPFMIINLKGLEILDFEIASDSVFFCGSLTSGENQYGVMGHFSLSGFPSVVVHYEIDSVKITCFNKIDVYYVDEQPHTVMTGIGGDGSSYMADAFPITPANWYFYIASGKEDPSFFDDVIYVKNYGNNYVVFSSRDENVLQQPFKIWRYKVPTAVNMPVFINPQLRDDFTNTLVDSPILLESMNGWFASVSKLANDSVFVSRYDLYGYSSSVKNRWRTNITVKDIEYNSFDFGFDVLISAPSGNNSVDSYIYDVDQAFFDVPAAMSVYLYEDEDINSLDILSAYNETYIASGHYALYNNLRVYRYSHNHWGCCQRESISPYKITYPRHEKSSEAWYTAYKGKYQKFSPKEGSIAVETICE